MNNKGLPSSTLLDGYKHENHSDCGRTERGFGAQREREVTVLLHEIASY
jgi:hypothetical protein